LSTTLDEEPVRRTFLDSITTLQAMLDGDATAKAR
jgi:hypothetical protein